MSRKHKPREQSKMCSIQSSLCRILWGLFFIFRLFWLANNIFSPKYSLMHNFNLILCALMWTLDLDHRFDLKEIIIFDNLALRFHIKAKNICWFKLMFCAQKPKICSPHWVRDCHSRNKKPFGALNLFPHSALSDFVSEWLKIYSSIFCLTLYFSSVSFSFLSK